MVVVRRAFVLGSQHYQLEGDLTENSPWVAGEMLLVALDAFVCISCVGFLVAVLVTWLL